MPDSPAHLVRRWRLAVGQPCADTPTLSTQNDRDLARYLILEEAEELIRAIIDAPWEKVDEPLANVAREMADLVWVVYGAAELFGIDLDRAISEVAAANMRKVGGPKRADGKVLKPDGWVGPDMARCISDMRVLGRLG